MSQAFYSPLDRLAEQMPRTKGTGAEFLTELSKRPGYKPVEAEDRNLQTLAALPKMERAQFLEALKAKKAVVPTTKVLSGAGGDDPRWRSREEQGEEDTAPHHEQYTLPGGKNYREILLQHPNPTEGGFGGVGAHFGGAPNILASIRAKDRVGPNGEKILHLEEIQSDWHQQGRKKGYVPRGVDLDREALIKKNAHLALQRRMQEAASASNMIDQDLASDKPLFQDPARRAHMEQRRIEHNNAIMDLFPQVTRAEEEHRQSEKRAREAISDAPYKKNWHELALKKMIHHAAERGYTHLAITPGAEQAKRYGLSRYLNSVSYRKSGDDNYHLVGKGKNDELVLPGHSLAAEDLHKFVGEELANKIRSTATNDPQHITGIGLDVGGEGMKGFYDKMVPDFLNKFGKKYGAQVGQVHIPINNGMHEPTPEGGWATTPPETRALHSFPITPEMRKDVLENGLPLYAEGGYVSREANKANFLKGSKVPERVYHGTGNLENLQAFDPALTGKGTDQLGSGFYFTTDPQEASGYASSFTQNQATKLGGGHAPGVVAAHLAIKKPLVVKGSNLNDTNVKLQHHHALALIKRAPNVTHPDESPLNNWADISRTGDIPKVMHDVAKSYTGASLISLGNDFYRDDPTAFRTAIRDVLGYDGVVQDFGGGHKHYVAWFPHQIKSAIGNRGTYDPNDPDITKAKGGSVKPVSHAIVKAKGGTISLDQMRHELNQHKKAK